MVSVRVKVYVASDNQTEPLYCYGSKGWCMKHSQRRMEEVTDEDLNLIECPECGRDDFKSNKGVALHHSKKHGFSVSMLYRCNECSQIKSGDNSDMQICPDCKWTDEDNTYVCPWDGCDRTFSSRNGRSVHHQQVHGESISGYKYQCEYCGDTFQSAIAPDNPNAPKYCPVKEIEGKSCEAKDREGKSREFSDEWKENISEGMKKAIEEGRASSPIAENDDEWVMENIIEPRDDEYLHKSLPEEVKEKVSKSLREAYRSGEREPASVRNIEVDETAHTVDSTWEKAIDLILFESEYEYKYNGDNHFPIFDLDDRSYIPDFVVGNNIIEVKGWLGHNYRQEKVEKAAQVLEEDSDWNYIVVGNVELPCDEYIKWSDRDELIEYLE
jgi:hypothetical protein